eukprot:1192162-Amphidinium_carterae.1
MAASHERLSKNKTLLKGVFAKCNSELFMSSNTTTPFGYQSPLLKPVSHPNRSSKPVDKNPSSVSFVLLLGLGNKCPMP